MLKIGLTGGIGSGKTAVSERFAALGIAIVDADLVARYCVAPGTQALQEIAAHYGDDIIQPNGMLDRAALRQRVFSDASERKWLESLLHPLIAARIQEELSTIDTAYAMLVSPLLLETNQASLVDRILLVDVPEEIQISRTMARDGGDRQQVEQILTAQMSRHERQAGADDILLNDGSLAELDARLQILHEQYLQLAGQATGSA